MLGKAVKIRCCRATVSDLKRCWPLPTREGLHYKDVGRESGYRSCRQLRSTSAGETTMQKSNSGFFVSIPTTFLLLVFSFSVTAQAAELRGTVFDPLGAVISHAKITLLRNNSEISHATTSDLGAFVFSSLKPGRYRVRALAAGFAEQESPEVYVSAGSSQRIEVSLKIGPVAQHVVVSATGLPKLDTQVGASIFVLSGDTLDSRLDLLEPLRLIPGAQVLQTGRRGGTTDL